jgi:UDP-N-acetylglucosamine 1-carboxyvinyltransferase
MSGIYRIRGGRPLEGKVRIRGAKNSALELMAASLLTAEPVVLKNVPVLSDITVMAELLRSLGTEIQWDKAKGEMRLFTPSVKNIRASEDIVGKMRASIYVLGALLGREGAAEIPVPGGCTIGARPIDVHFRLISELGAKLTEKNGFVHAEGPLAGAVLNGLVRMEGNWEVTTHGGNVNAIMAASLVKGRTVITHATLEPEVDDLISMLNAMGAKIWREGNTIAIDGVSSLRGVEYTVMPDRLEAATYAVAGIITRGEVELEHADITKMEAVVASLRAAGGEISATKNGFVAGGRKVKRFKPIEVSAAMYPAVPTDAQAQIMALATLADGVSSVRELIFENRLMYVPEFRKLGAKIDIIDSRAARFTGVPALQGAALVAPDIRAGAALAITALAAEGESTLSAIHHVLRGYQDFAENLRSLGASIE